jgi:hypothetical protein
MDKKIKVLPDSVINSMKSLKSLNLEIPNIPILTPPEIDYVNLNKSLDEKRRKDNTRFWLMVYLTLINILIVTLTYFKN